MKEYIFKSGPFAIYTKPQFVNFMLDNLDNELKHKSFRFLWLRFVYEKQGEIKWN